MKYTQVFETKYLSAKELLGPNEEIQEYEMIIRAIELETIRNDEGKEEHKLIAYFNLSDGRQVKKGLMFNRTNANMVADKYGDETDDWIGKTVILYPTKVQFKGDMVWGIRLRHPAAPAQIPDDEEPPF